MLRYITHRMILMAPVLLIVSVVSFSIIQLPPGDFLTYRIMQLKLEGTEAGEGEIASLRHQYGLDRPVYEQYFLWMKGLLTGDLGWSFQWNRPVRSLIGERLLMSMTISLCSIFLTWSVAIPIGIYSALRQYSLLDYAFTLIGFVGLATPAFMLALVLMYVLHAQFDLTITGMFSPQYAIEPWSWGKFLDLLRHVWVPAMIVGMAGTASMIRVMRGCLLDELRKQYVMTARAKGLREWRLILKYPVWLAANPMLSTIGLILPAIVSGETVVSIVLNIPTCGPMLLEALRSQDMYLAGSLIMILSALTVVGMLISDILLAWSDPRIRYD